MKKLLVFLLLIAISFTVVLPAVSYAQGTQVLPPEVIETIPDDINTAIGGGCNFSLRRGFSLTKCIGYIVFTVLYTMTGWVVYLGSLFLNYIVILSVSNGFFGDPAIMGTIQSVWAGFRDLANIGFIFILIYIGLATMLRLSTSETYRLLGRVILIAILINFSLVITQVVIDASHVFSVGFLSSFPPDTTLSGLFSGSTFVDQARDLSEPILTLTNPQSASGSAFDNWAAGPSSSIFSLIILGIVASIANIVLGFVLFAGAILFLTRLVALTFLMMVAPLAFAAYILPGTQHYATQWWDKLIKQAFFAPIFLALFAASSKLFSNIGATLFDPSSPPVSFLGSLIRIVVLYAIATSIAIAAIIVSKSLGAHGAAAIISTGRKYGKRAGNSVRRGGRNFAGYAGRHTVGRAARGAANSKAAGNFAARNPRLGSLALRPLDAAAAASFGGRRGGYDKSVKDQVKREEKLHDRLKEDKLGNTLMSKRTEVYRGTDGKRKVRQITLQEEHIQEIEKRRGLVRRFIPTQETFSKTRKYGDVKNEHGEVVASRFARESIRQTPATRMALRNILKEKNKSKGDKLLDSVRNVIEESEKTDDKKGEKTSESKSDNTNDNS